VAEELGARRLRRHRERRLSGVGEPDHDTPRLVAQPLGPAERLAGRDGVALQGLLGRPADRDHDVNGGEHLRRDVLGVDGDEERLAQLSR
jgi:hypothetical protein